MTPDVVRSFYEHHPYPPPVADLTSYRWDDERRRVEHHRIWPTAVYRSDPSILVAGCGTSQAAKYAVRWPDADVVGIDVSQTGLANNQALADRHGLANLELRELAIEDVSALDRRFDRGFDLIVCTGVLHHLADPDHGLATLREVLVPGGALKLMVYARYGRLGIEMLQRYCRLLGIGASAGEIADLVETLREMPLGHPMRPVLRDTPDFQNDDALADALLNPRERSYSVPELLELLDGAKVAFSRWFHQAPYRADCGSLTSVPHGETIAGLAPRDHYAAVELFRGTMTRHTVIAHRDRPNTITFDGDGWLDFVPMRPSTSVAVSERLPPGAAAALLNRAHTDSDLVLFVDGPELEWYQSIDGRRPIRTLAGHDRVFVERLWHHDLIVIDAAGAGGQ